MNEKNFKALLNRVYGTTSDLLVLFDNGVCNGREYGIVYHIPKKAVVENEAVKNWFIAWTAKNGKAQTRIKRGLENLVNAKCGVSIWYPDFVYLDDLREMQSYKDMHNYGRAFEEFLSTLRAKNIIMTGEADAVKKQDLKIGYNWTGEKITYRYVQVKCSIHNASVNI